jgi:hypothetical protein
MPRLSLVLKYLRCAGKTVHRAAGDDRSKSALIAGGPIMNCAAAAQSVTTDEVDRSSPTPKSSNCPRVASRSRRDRRGTGDSASHEAKELPRFGVLLDAAPGHH